jgi:hypothetical protein
VSKVGTSNPARTISFKRLQCVVENKHTRRLKRPGPESDHSTPLIFEVKTEWICIRVYTLYPNAFMAYTKEN